MEEFLDVKNIKFLEASVLFLSEKYAWKLRKMNYQQNQWRIGSRVGAQGASFLYEVLEMWICDLGKNFKPRWGGLGWGRGRGWFAWITDAALGSATG